MKYVFKNTEIQTRQVTAKDGKTYTFRTQDCMVHKGEEIRSTRYALAENQGAFAVGEYELDIDASTYFDKYGSPALSRTLVLVSAKAAVNLRATG